MAPLAGELFFGVVRVINYKYLNIHTYKGI